MVMKYALLMVSFVALHNVYGMENKQEAKKEEFRIDAFLRRIEKEDLPNMVGKTIVYRTHMYKEGILGSSYSDSDYYCVYNDETKNREIFLHADELFHKDEK
jgi:hypothetical protein